MENDYGLELRLGLSCGGSSADSQGIIGSSLDIRAEDGERTNTIVADFKNFLNAVDQRQVSGAGSQISNTDKPQENFFTDLSKCGDANVPMQSNGNGLLVSDSHRSAESEDERRRESGSRSYIAFEITHQKQLNIESNHPDFHENLRASHISVTADGSAGENEDVAESEVKTSTSKTPEVMDLKVVDLQAQKRFKSSHVSDLKMENYASSCSAQPAKSGNESSPVDAFGTSSLSLPLMIQAVNASSSEQLDIKPAVSGNFPLMFGYSHAQFPVLKDNSLGQISHVQQIHPSYTGKGPPQSASMHVSARDLLEPTNYDGGTIDQAKGVDKQYVGEEGSSSQNENDVKGGITSLGRSDRSTAEFISFDYPDIKSGIAADIKFKGTGSCTSPCTDLPWVSTTGSGPNGRTISGVPYRHSTSHIIVVCACHGFHMTPENFIRHASEEQDGKADHPKTNPVTSN